MRSGRELLLASLAVPVGVPIANDVVERLEQLGRRTQPAAWRGPAQASRLGCDGAAGIRVSQCSFPQTLTLC